MGPIGVLGLNSYSYPAFCVFALDEVKVLNERLSERTTLELLLNCAGRNILKLKKQLNKQ